MFKILAWIIRYVFIILIYYFLFGIIRLIYLDIKSINRKGQGYNNPYLKLINRKELLDFHVQEFYDLTEQTTTIGRRKYNSIQLLDKYISSNHAKIVMDEGEYFLEDLESVNGTYLNGTKIEDVVKLKKGDRIGVGQVEFLFVKEVENDED